MQETEARAHPGIEGLDTRFTFENFVVGAPNQLAFAIAKRVAESPEATYNPLFLYGGVGLGKTHLMHAIAWEIHFRQPHRKVMYLSAEKFMYRFHSRLALSGYDVFQRAVPLCRCVDG
jgi:chromosomal replication initiator protein